MKNIKYFALALILAASVGCRKKNTDVIPPVTEEPAGGPAMTYIDLTGKTLSRGQFLNLDVDGDKKLDLYFYTQDVSDNLNSRVKLQFIGGAYIAYQYNFLISDVDDDVIPALTKGQDILSNTNKNTWFNLGEAVMMQQVLNTITNTITWEGNWVDKGHLYLPFKQLLPGGTYNYGWVELEANSAQQRLIFYRAAICKETGSSVKAGM